MPIRKQPFFNVGTIDEVVEKAHMMAKERRKRDEMKFKTEIRTETVRKNPGGSKQKGAKAMSTFWLKVIASDHVFYDGSCEGTGGAGP